MKKMPIFKGRKRTRRSESNKPLIENNNNNINDGNDRAGYMCENPLAQNTFNTAEEESMQRQENISILELAQHLGVPSESIYNSTEPNLELLNVSDWPRGQTFNMLQNLLQELRSASHCLLLMNWVRNTYMSKEVVFNPDHKMFCEWEEKATKKLLESVQKEIRDSLDKILLNETRTEGWKEEDYVKLYVDTIQCINAMPSEAQKICPKLHDQVKEVCFQEFLTFVKRYSVEQTKHLEKKAEMDKPETIHFLKTLKTCKELGVYVRTKGAGITASLVEETLSTLKTLEASTLALLIKIVTNIAENYFKDYFKSDKRLNIMHSVQNHFPNLPYVSDELNLVMNGAYEVITHTYLKHLIKCSQSSLKKRWGPDVGDRIIEDAKQIHNTISETFPGVREWHRMLLYIQEMVACKSIDPLKVILAHMQRDYLPQSEDLDLGALLKWKGLSKSEVREVLDALPDSESRPTSTSCFSCFICS